MSSVRKKFSLKDIFSHDSLRAFFMSKYYAVLVCVIVVVGYLTGAEFYLHLINMALLTVALFHVDSLRPVITVLCTFVFQISRHHTPADFNMDEAQTNLYYFEGARGVIFVLSFVPVACALVMFFIRNKLINKASLRSLPMLIPSGVLALAFALNGVFSGGWTVGNLGFGLVQAFIWFIIPYLFILGLKNEKSGSLISYFVFLASLIVIIILIEVADIYLNTDGIITEDRGVVRELFTYGWGNCNTGAQALVVLIPILFIGATLGGNKRQVYYFAMATLAMLGIFLNVSRSGFLIGGMAYAVCTVVSFIKSNKKPRFLIEVGAVLVGVAIIVISFNNIIFTALQDYINRGVGDTGRFSLWAEALRAFTTAPTFGKGFFGLSEYFNISNPISTIAFLPDMSHNTVAQFLGAMGVFGLLAYGFYRICSFRPFFKKPSYLKTMLGGAMLTVLGGSLLDNFIFNILPMFMYAVLFAIVYKLESEDGEKKNNLLF